MAERPALKFSLLLAAGIIAGRAASFTPEACFWTASLLLGAALALRARRGVAAGFPVQALVAALGALLFSAEIGGVPADDPSAYITSDTVTIHGTVLESAGRSSRSVRLLVDCDSIVRDDLSRALRGRVLVFLSGRAADSSLVGALGPGRGIAVRAPLRAIEPARNPGETDWRSHYLLGGIRVRMNVRIPGHVVPGLERRDGFLNRFVLPVRRALSARLGSLTGDREARFLNGLILGERNEVPSDLKADFTTAGVMHLLAISGQQVVLVAMLLAALLKVLRIPEITRFVAVSCALAYYVALTGGSPSVTRAGIMAIVMLGARVAQRRPDIFNALGVSAGLILMADPAQLFDPGFLLSYAAVLALVLLYPLLLAAAPGLTARCARMKPLDLAWKGTAVSLAAGLGTAPIVAWFFGRVSLVGFLANLLIVPLSSAALVLGILAICASFVGPWIAAVYAAGAGASARLTFGLVEFFAGFPSASVNVRISTWALCAAYGMLGLVLVCAARKRWKPLLFGTLVLCNIIVFREILLPRAGDVLRVTFLDVGQGDAAFVEFPGGKTMLIDGGPRTFSFDAGERAVVPFLRHMDAGRIDYLILTHPHGDHLGGVAAVMGAVPVGRVIEGGSAGRGGMYARFVRVSDSLGVPREFRLAGDVIGQELPARIYVIAPERGGEIGRDNLNDRSVALMIRYGRTGAVFPGDAEAGSERSMVHRYGRFLDAELLKAGHHGSRTSSTEDFLKSVSPLWTVISAGEGNSFGHPSPVVLGRLAGLGSAIHRTDLSGAAVYESDGTAWRRVDRREWP